MSTSLSIKAICLTVALASGLSLPGGAVLAGPPQANNENQRDRGRVTDARPRDSVADTRPTRGADGQRGRAEVGSDTRQRRSDGDGNAQAGNRGGNNTQAGNRGGNNAQVVNQARRDAQTHGGNPSGGEQAGDGAVSMMDESSPMIATPMMDESSPLVFELCEDTPGGNVQASTGGNPDAGNGVIGYPEEFEVGTNVATQMGGTPDGFQADTNVHSQMSGNPDGFQEERNLTAQIDGLTAQIDGLTAQIDGVTPCGLQAGQPAR